MMMMIVVKDIYKNTDLMSMNEDNLTISGVIETIILVMPIEVETSNHRLLQ